jgi:hypothetical protein
LIGADGVDAMWAYPTGKNGLRQVIDSMNVTIKRASHELELTQLDCHTLDSPVSTSLRFSHSQFQGNRIHSQMTTAIRAPIGRFRGSAQL